MSENMLEKKTKVLVILGPTGAGKSDMAVSLAKIFSGQIISADSVQVYKGLDIGSAKITKQEMQGVVHYGIDILEPDQEFDAHQFLEQTKAHIRKISHDGKLPIIVGGTNMYINALVKNYNLGGKAKDEDLREKITSFIDDVGQEQAYLHLKEINSHLASNLDYKNKARLIRTLEIAMQDGKKEKGEQNEFDFLLLCVTMDREKLYQRINARVIKMIESGLEEETRDLYSKYGQIRPLNAIGYKEMVEYIKRNIDLENCISQIQQHTRNYAKRQLTFLRSMKDVVYIDRLCENYLDIAKKEVETWLRK